MEDKRQEDMDMLYVFKSIRNGIINIFKGIGWLLSFSLKKSLALLVFIILFISLFIGFYSLQKPYYSSELVISHTRFNDNFCGIMINNLNSYISNSADYTELAKILSMDLSEAQQIRNIRYNTLSEHLAKRYVDSVSVFLPFKVEAEVYNNDILDKLQKGIMNYLETNEYATRRKEIDQQALIKTEERIKNEIKETDSLKRLVDQSIIPRGNGNGIIIGEPIDPVSVYKRSLDLYERQLELNKKQVLNSSFEVIVGFIKKSSPANAGLFFYIFLGIIAGYVIGITWLLARRSRTKTSQ